MTRLAFVLLALVACSKKDEQPSSSGASSSTTSSSSGATGPLPAFELKPVDDSEAKDIATLKERSAAAVSKWLTEETTSDGWIVSYEIPHKENVQDEKTLKLEVKQTGVDYGVYVRRTIDGKQYKCVTTHIEKREDIARVIDACKKAKPTR